MCPPQQGNTVHTMKYPKSLTALFEVHSKIREVSFDTSNLYLWSLISICDRYNIWWQETWFSPRASLGARNLLGTGVLSRAVQWAKHEIKHSLLSSAEITNEWSYTSMPPTSLHGVDRGNFAFTFLKHSNPWYRWQRFGLNFRVRPRAEMKIYCGLVKAAVSSFRFHPEACNYACRYVRKSSVFCAA
jgi:hypothetical protein